jgi:hypothetical protein
MYTGVEDVVDGDERSAGSIVLTLGFLSKMHSGS